MYAQTCHLQHLTNLVNFFCHFRYIPPFLWGKNGHLHTFVFSKFSPKVKCQATWQHSVKLEDNSTVIFDIFEPCLDEKHKVEFFIISYMSW